MDAIAQQLSATDAQGSAFPGGDCGGRMDRTRKALRTGMLAVVLSIGGIAAGPGAGLAHADDQPFIRQMDWNRYDFLMASETRRIATDPGAAAWACRGAIAAGVAGGAPGLFATSSTCITAVTVCAAQAATKGKWAGLTFTVLPPNFWCWTY